MGSYNRDDNKRGGGSNRSFGGNKSYGGGRDSGGRDGGRPTMHRATCSDCGDSCEVPFKPTGSKPIFCSDCFGKQDSAGRGNTGRDSGRSNRFGGDRRDRSSREDRQMHDAICNKCGKNCQVPFKPTAGKDIFCSECFEQSGGNKGRKDGNSDEELKTINIKLDMIMTALGLSGPKKEKKEKKVEEKIEKKEATTKKPVAKKKPATKKATEAKPKAKAKKVVKKKAVAKKKK